MSWRNNIEAISIIKIILTLKCLILFIIKEALERILIKVIEKKKVRARFLLLRLCISVGFSKHLNRLGQSPSSSFIIYLFSF